MYTNLFFSDQVADSKEENARMKIRILELEHQVSALKAEIAESSLNTIHYKNKVAIFHVSQIKCIRECDGQIVSFFHVFVQSSCQLSHLS